MLYLVTPHNDNVKKKINDGTLGTFVTPKSGSWPKENLLWAGDNGSYSGFDEAAFLIQLRQLTRFASSCLFMTVPDSVGNWDGTLALFDQWEQRVADYGYPTAIVLQNGATPESVPWDRIGAVFIGGTTEWKLGTEAALIVKAANERGKHAHMGRVNSYKRLLYATQIGCDSSDGTFLRFAPDKNLPRLQRWLDKLENFQQQILDA